MPPIQIPPDFLQALKKKKIKLVQQDDSTCCVCGTNHPNAGMYICLCCGAKICTRKSIGEHTAEVMPHHAVISYSGQMVRCGPAIKISAVFLTSVQITKDNLLPTDELK